MKVAAAEVMNAMMAAQAIAQKPMPAKAAYWVARLIAKLEGEFKTIQTQRNALIQKHAGEGRQMIDADDPERVQAFIAEFQPILESEIEVNAEPLKIDVFGDCNLTASDIIQLGKFVD